MYPSLSSDPMKIRHTGTITTLLLEKCRLVYDADEDHRPALAVRTADEVIGHTYTHRPPLPIAHSQQRPRFRSSTSSPIPFPPDGRLIPPATQAVNRSNHHHHYHCHYRSGRCRWRPNPPGAPALPTFDQAFARLLTCHNGQPNRPSPPRRRPLPCW